MRWRDMRLQLRYALQFARPSAARRLRTVFYDPA